MKPDLCAIVITPSNNHIPGLLCSERGISYCTETPIDTDLGWAGQDDCVCTGERHKTGSQRELLPRPFRADKTGDDSRGGFRESQRRPITTFEDTVITVSDSSVVTSVSTMNPFKFTASAKDTTSRITSGGRDNRRAILRTGNTPSSNSQMVPSASSISVASPMAHHCAVLTGQSSTQNAACVSETSPLS